MSPDRTRQLRDYFIIGWCGRLHGNTRAWMEVALLTDAEPWVRDAVLAGFDQAEEHLDLLDELADEYARTAADRAG